jgi:hypothetical protein
MLGDKVTGFFICDQEVYTCNKKGRSWLWAQFSFWFVSIWYDLENITNIIVFQYYCWFVVLLGKHTQSLSKNLVIISPFFFFANKIGISYTVLNKDLHKIIRRCVVHKILLRTKVKNFMVLKVKVTLADDSNLSRWLAKLVERVLGSIHSSYF